MDEMEQCLMLYVQFCAPDDGLRNRLKHVQQFIEIIDRENVESCWLYFRGYTCDARTYERQI